VALVGFFPRAAFLLGTLLLLPVSLVLILLTIRSVFMVFDYSLTQYGGILRIISGVTGLLIPGLLVSVLPITLGGFIDYTGASPQLLFGKLLLTPTEYAHLGFGLATELFLSALFLSDYALEAEDAAAYQVYRNAAITTGPLMLGFAALTTFTMVPEAQWIVEGMKQQWLWFALSVISFLIGYSALWWKNKEITGRPRIAFITIILQFAFASYGYGKAHLPYIIYPHLTVEQGFTNPVMFHSLLIGYFVGMAIMIPVFIWFWKLFMQDKKYLKQE
jgi:cytochrome d ubiquinol oxidase subunit II